MRGMVSVAANVKEWMAQRAQQAVDSSKYAGWQVTDITDDYQKITVRKYYGDDKFIQSMDATIPMTAVLRNG